MSQALEAVPSKGLWSNNIDIGATATTQLVKVRLCKQEGGGQRSGRRGGLSFRYYPPDWIKVKDSDGTPDIRRVRNGLSRFDCGSQLVEDDPVNGVVALPGITARS